MRAHNLALVLWSVVHEPGSRADVAARTGLTKATVSSLVDELIDRGLVAEDLPVVSGRGRPSRRLLLHPGAPTVVGLEANVDYVAAVRTALDGHELAAHRVDIDLRGRSLDDITAQLAAAWRAVGASRSTLAGTGLAVPGLVAHDGTVVRAPNVPALTGARVDAALAARLRLPRHSVSVDNEANLAALAELAQPSAERDFLYVSGEIGVGAGIVIGGELFRGAGGMAGELGHLSIALDGLPCTCGGSGCVEQYAGQDALTAATGAATVDALVAGVRSGRASFVRAVDDAGHALGTGIANVLNVVDVHTVVLGGLYARLFDALAPAVQAELDRRVLSSTAPRLAVRAARAGADAAARGAAAAVVRRAMEATDGLVAAPD